MSFGCGAGQYVGPYMLDKTLGKGQTGLVKMGVHCVTKEKVAIKVINREKLPANVLNKVEREIAIMKLIDHQHVLGLLDVYENKRYLYLILELISGGELFDYLVKKGRLSSREARYFFRQIISAVDFCHQHNVCHRDLKPENLLLDEDNSIKVADFGMASLQPEGYLLETSCGSPHYACPEVIRGDKYDGRTADVWSCGVILFALLVGALPFDDDNLRQLLEKVKRGVFYIPHFVPPDAQKLLRGMLEVRPEKRLTLKAVLSHQWMRAGDVNDVDTDDVNQLSTPFECVPIAAEEDADPDVLLSMGSLGCFRDRQKLIANLISKEKNTEKVVYHLLLRRKIRCPSIDDDADSLPCKHPDAPRKRVDSTSSSRSLSSSIDDISVGERSMSSSSLSSARYRGCVSRKTSVEAQNGGERPSSMSKRGISVVHQRSRSLTTEPKSRIRSSGSNASNKVKYPSSGTHYKASSSQNNSARQSTESSSRGNYQAASSSPTNQWRQRLTNLKNSVMGSPRFHRRKEQMPSNEDITGSTPSMSPSMELTKRSWFSQFVSGSSSSINNRDRDEPYLILVMSNRTLSSVRSDLGHAFLYISNLSHTVNSYTQYFCEYRSHSSSSRLVFSNKLVKFQVDLIRVTPSSDLSDGEEKPLTLRSHGDFHVIFNLISGPNRRFKRVLELIQIQLEASLYVKPESNICVYSRELQKYCTSAANIHNEATPRKSRNK